MSLGKRVEAGALSDSDVAEMIGEACGQWDPRGSRVVVLIPDLTRSGPVSLLFRLLSDRLSARVSRLDFMIALGTHPPLSEAQIERLVGMPAAQRATRYPNVSVLNHEWDRAEALEKIGEIPGPKVEEATGGLLSDAVDVVLNRRVLRDYDQILICGPVFPHEVAGFSGGNKYLFPGVSGNDFVQFFHWLGAIHTNPKINGHQWTPVRAFIDQAAGMVPLPRKAFCFVTEGQKLGAIFFGDVDDAWNAAVEVSRSRQIRYVDRPYQSVLAEAPAMYDDLWVGGKCMYKLEPIVADGGELIIYAPHIREVSPVHGRVLDEIGYHTRDYFTAQWDRFRGYPWGVVAHATHVRGIGTYAGGVESPRVRVTLATGIPKARCDRISLGYRDPATIRIEDWQGRESEGYLHVHHAGEILYRLNDPPEWARSVFE